MSVWSQATLWETYPPVVCWPLFTIVTLMHKMLTYTASDSFNILHHKNHSHYFNDVMCYIKPFPVCVFNLTALEKCPSDFPILKGICIVQSADVVHMAAKSIVNHFLLIRRVT